MEKIKDWFEDKLRFLKKLWKLFRYDIPHFFHNLWYFKNILWKYGNWDFCYTLEFMLLSLKPLREGINNGNEINETRNKKIIQMDKAIELLQNFVDDNFIEQAEKVHGELILHPWKTKPVDNKPDYTELLDQYTPEEKEHNNKVFDLSHKLEQEQWIELWNIIKGDKNTSASFMHQVTTDEKNDNISNDCNESARSWWW